MEQFTQLNNSLVLVFDKNFSLKLKYTNYRHLCYVLYSGD